MWFFRQKPVAETQQNEQSAKETPRVEFDPSILRQNNITRLSIDERWTKLFVAIKMNQELEAAEKEMSELIKKEAMLKNEQENLEPKKRKCMNEIISLTQEAFENDNHEAKGKLKECKKEIEKINGRMNAVLEEIEKLEEDLKTANLKLLENSMAYIFSTLKTNSDKAIEIKNELAELELREKALREELEAISTGWTQSATDLTELIGADQVKNLEEQFGLEGLNDEAADTTADEDHRQDSY